MKLLKTLLVNLAMVAIGVIAMFVGMIVLGIFIAMIQ